MVGCLNIPAGGSTKMPTMLRPHPKMAELSTDDMSVFGYYEVEVWEIDEDEKPTNLVARKLTFEPNVTLSEDDGLVVGRNYALFVRFIGSSDTGPKISDRIAIPDFLAAT